MRNLKAIILFMLTGVVLSCKNKGSKSSGYSKYDQVIPLINDFEKQLTADSVFWQSEYGMSVDFLFRKDGSAISLMNGSQKMTGKWFFDKSARTLEVSWTRGKQYSAKVKRIVSDWSNIKISDKLHDYGTAELKRMKLLDGRFEK